MITITDGENTYSYNYDSNGIRVSKKVNDITTSFDTLNGKILAQYDKKNKLYFQYNGDTPIGFVLNDTQYLYITNLKGDIVGITDIEGNLICKYTYDEWGKLLNIETAEENNAEQLSVAQINPLRYRGYYYDNESGLYYLQSRYYNPELCRFISADGFSYIDTSNYLSLNAYIYCWNCPVAFDDIEGTKPNISINLASIQALLSKSTPEIAARLQEHFDKLQAKFNAFVEKAKFYLQNPDVFINKMLSKLLGREVNIRFRLLEYIKANIHKSDDEEENSESGISTYAFNPNIAADEKTDNWLVALIKALAIAIPVNSIVIEFEAFMQVSNKSFDISSWFNKLSEKIQNTILDMGVFISTLLNTAWKEGKEYVEDFFTYFTFDKLVDWLINDTVFSIGVDFLIEITAVFDNRDKGKYTNGQALTSLAVNAVFTLVSLFIPMGLKGVIGLNIADFVTNFVLDGVFNYQNGHLWGF